MPVIELRPRLAQIETNPQFAQILPLSEMVVLVDMEVKLGELGSRMRLCLPYLALEPVAERLTAQFMYGKMASQAGDGSPRLPVAGVVRCRAGRAGRRAGGPAAAGRIATAPRG